MEVILLNEEGVQAGGEELSSDPVEVGQQAGQLISHYSLRECSYTV